MKKNLKLYVVLLLIGSLFVTGVFCEVFHGDANNPDPLTAQVLAGSTYEQAKQEALGSNYATPTENTQVAPSAPTPAATSKKCDHTYTEEVTRQPTCKEEGVKTFTCSKCGNSYTEEIPVSDTHDYKEEVTTEATCTEAGEKTFICSVCGDTYTEEIPALEHDYKEEVTTEPTCTEKGVNTFICSRCSDTYTEEIPATGHSEGEWEVTKPAGWFTVGEQVQKCATCGEILATEVIPTQYPMWYLYAGIGVIAVIIIAVVVVIVMKKKKK